MTPRISIFLFALFFLFASLFPTQRSEAAAWPVMDPLIKQGLEALWGMVQGIIASAAKQAGIKAIYGQISAKIGGSSSGGAMFIVNWQDFLIDQPEKAAGQYLNDYLSQATKGRGSLSGYISNGASSLGLRIGQNYEGVGPGSFSLGLANNDPAYTKLVETARAKGMTFNLGMSANTYISNLVEKAKLATVDKPMPEITYKGNPAQMFADGTFKNSSLWASGINPPWSFSRNAEQIYEKEKTELKKVASDKAIANQGFPGGEDGKMPGIAAKEMLVKSMAAPIDSLTSAQGLQGIAQAFVTSMVGKFFDEGIGKVSASVSKTVSNAKSNISAQMNAAVKTNGPSALYNNGGKFGGGGASGGW